MPIIKSAKKALRQNARRRQKNIKRKTELKTVIKQYKKLLENNPEEAKKLLPQVYKKLDKSAKVNVIKKNKASRLKSRLTKKLKTSK
ncbi:MAG TPA: 30S ribosomal protein S20 [Candidatus Wolfebacteria bacterium]|nr:30S ribosomal protein S20 [Candidatus Wolfebacteria bacterium]